MKISLIDRIKRSIKAFVWFPSNPFSKIIVSAGNLRKGSVETDPAGGYAGFAYAAVSKRCKRVGAIKLKLYELRGKSQDVVEVDDSEAMSLFYRANPMQSMYKFFYTLELMLSIWGAAPVYKERLGRRVANLWPLRPDLLTANRGTDGTVSTYTYRVQGSTKQFAASDIVMINEPNPADYLTGMSAVSAAGLEIDADMAAAIWNKCLLDNWAEPGFVLSTEQQLSDETFDRLKAQWNARHAGPHNAGREAILEAGLKPEIIGRSPTEMQLTETRKFNRDAITTIIGVPISLITGDANLANAEVGERVFARDTVDPEMRLITGEFNEFLIPEINPNQYLDYESPIPDDIVNKIALATAGEGRFLTPNDCRNLFQGSFDMSLPAMKGGDAIYKPLGVYPMVEGEKSKGMVLPPDVKFEKIEMKGEKEESKKVKEIRQKILARTYLKRAILDGVKNRVFDSINKAAGGKDGKIVVKISNVKATLKQTGDEEVEIDPRLKNERLLFLKGLETEQKKFIIQLKDFFRDQMHIVLDNLKEADLPKGRTARGRKVNFGNWFNQIIFPKKEQDDLLVAISGQMYRDNINTGAEAIRKLLGLSPDTDILNSPKVIDYIQARSFIMLGVNQTTREALRRSLEEGVAQGEAMGELRNRISSIYGEAEGFRAETITRTEVGSAQNFGRGAEMKDQGIENKMWISIFSNSRDAHMAAHGQVVGVNEAFQVGGEYLQFPGDPDASPENTINCQCSISPTLRAKT